MAPRSPIRGPRSIHFSSPERKSAFATNAWEGVTRSGGPPPDVTRPSAQRYKGDRGKSGSGHTVSGQVGDRGCACHREDGTPGEETGRADARLDHGQPDTDDYHSTALRLVPVAERQLRRSIRGRGLIWGEIRDGKGDHRPTWTTRRACTAPAGPADSPVPPIDTTARGAGVRVAGVRVAGGRGFGGGGTSVSATRPIACGAPAGRQMVGGPSGAPGRSRRDRVRSPTVGGPAPASDSDGRARQPHGHVCVHEGFSLGWRLRAQPPPAGGTVIGPVERAGGPRRSGTDPGAWLTGRRGTAEVGDVPQGGSVGREAGLVCAGQPPRGVRRENPRERDKTRRRADSERSRGRMAARARGGSGGSAAGRRRTRLGARRVGPGRSPGARVSAGGGQRSVSRATVPDDQHEAGRRLARLDSHERGRGGHSSVRLRSKAGRHPLQTRSTAGATE